MQRIAALPLLAVATAALSAQTTPAAGDLMIKTERRSELPSGAHVSIDTLYIKGARQRHESMNRSDGPRWITITQCDQKRTVMIDMDTKLYASSPQPAPSELFLRRHIVKEDPTGPLVRITIDSVDTGERRAVGSHVARRITRTEITEQREGPRPSRVVQQQDGWYLDLPAGGCDRPQGMAVLVAGERNARVQIEHRGTARPGYPIEETNSVDGFVTTTKLIEFSEAPLDSALFTVPPDYRAALPLVGGGYDLARADTFFNRVQSYWETLTGWATSLFR